MDLGQDPHISQEAFDRVEGQVQGRGRYGQAAVPVGEWLQKDRSLRGVFGHQMDRTPDLIGIRLVVDGYFDVDFLLDHRQGLRKDLPQSGFPAVGGKLDVHADDIDTGRQHLQALGKGPVGLE